jgi:hypothetical protein
MIIEYIEAALSKAKYEIIGDEEPYYGEVPELEGVWATGKTLEECRKKTIPNPHRKEISVDLLSRILKQAELQGWNGLKNDTTVRKQGFFSRRFLYHAS